MEVEAIDETIIRTESLHNQLVIRPSTDLVEISDKNPPKELVRLVHKFIKLVTKISNKVQELKT